MLRIQGMIVGSIALILAMQAAFLGPVLGKERAIKGVVWTLDEKGTRTPAANTLVVLGDYRITSTTNDRGEFVIPLPEILKAGHGIQLYVMMDGWWIWTPVGRQWVVPLRPEHPTVDIEMVAFGSSRWLEDRSIEEALGETVRVSAPRLFPDNPPSADQWVESLRPWAKNVGTDPGAVATAAWQWGEKNSRSLEPRKRALSAFVQMDYDRAVQLFIEAGDAELKQPSADPVERIRQAEVAAKNYRSAAALHEMHGALEPARVLTEKVLGLFPQDQHALQWAQTQADRGRIYAKMGTQAEGEPSRDYLHTAAKALAAAADVYTFDQWPRVSMENYLELAVTFRYLGMRTPGEDGVALLEKSVKLYRICLEVSDTSMASLYSGRIGDGLATALRERAKLEEGKNAASLLADAVAAYRVTLKHCRRQDSPTQWAKTQFELGSTLFLQAQQTEGDQRFELSGAAIEATRRALEVYTERDHPAQWAGAQALLAGATLWETSTLWGEKGPSYSGVFQSRAVEAANAMRNALRVLTPQMTVGTWVTLQMGLATCLVLIGSAETDTRAKVEYLLEAATELERVTAGLKGTPLQDNAEIQTTIAGTVAMLKGNFSKAAEEGDALYEADPNNRMGYLLASAAYHEGLYDFERAHQLNARWVAAHPEDDDAQVFYVTTHITTARFAEALQRIEPLRSSGLLDGETRIRLSVLEIVALCGVGRSEEAPAELTALIKDMESLPKDFEYKEWSRGLTLFAGAHPSLESNRRRVLSLLSAMDQPNRGAAAAALRTVAQQW